MTSHALSWQRTGAAFVATTLLLHVSIALPGLLTTSATSTGFIALPILLAGGAIAAPLLTFRGLAGGRLALVALLGATYLLVDNAYGLGSASISETASRNALPAAAYVVAPGVVAGLGRRLRALAAWLTLLFTAWLFLVLGDALLEAPTAFSPGELRTSVAGTLTFVGLAGVACAWMACQRS